VSFEEYIDGLVEKHGADYNCEDDPIVKMHTKLRRLLPKVSDSLVDKFFDFDSVEALDDKIEVMTALSEGKAPCDIPKYYGVLELYPPEGKMWD
jgi:hypothetical protein